MRHLLTTLALAAAASAQLAAAPMRGIRRRAIVRDAWALAEARILEDEDAAATFAAAPRSLSMGVGGIEFMVDAGAEMSKASKSTSSPTTTPSPTMSKSTKSTKSSKSSKALSFSMSLPSKSGKSKSSKSDLSFSLSLPSKSSKSFSLSLPSKSSKSKSSKSSKSELSFSMAKSVKSAKSKGTSSPTTAEEGAGSKSAKKGKSAAEDDAGQSIARSENEDRFAIPFASDIDSQTAMYIGIAAAVAAAVAVAAIVYAKRKGAARSQPVGQFNNSGGMVMG